MKYPDKNSSPLQRILESERMTREIPAEIRKNVPVSMRRGYRDIMKKTGRLTLLSSIAAIVYFLMRKAGTLIPGAKIVIPLTVATITAGGIVAVQLTEKIPDPVLMVRPLQSTTLSPSLTAASTRHLAEGFNTINKNIQSSISAKNSVTGTPYIMIGNMEKSGKTIFVTIRVINPVTSGILFIKEATATDESALAAVLTRLGVDISKKIEENEKLKQKGNTGTPR